MSNSNTPVEFSASSCRERKKMGGGKVHLNNEQCNLQDIYDISVPLFWILNPPGEGIRNTVSESKVLFCTYETFLLYKSEI